MHLIVIHNNSNITKKNTNNLNNITECRGCNLPRDKYLAPMSKYFQIEMLLQLLERKYIFNKTYLLTLKKN